MLELAENQQDRQLSHLKENDIGYFRHLLRAWRWGFILFVHGIFPNIWTDIVSDEMLNARHKKYWKFESTTMDR